MTILKFNNPETIASSTRFCAIADKIPGEERNLNESVTLNNSTIKTIKNIPTNHPILVSINTKQKKAISHLKIVNSDAPNCHFFVVPSTEKALRHVKPVLKYLINDNIFVLKNTKEPDRSVVTEQLRQSFYNDDGTLKNKKFSLPNLLPHKMAEAGWEFIGDESNDLVRCFGNHNHCVHNWTEKGDPIGTHVRNFSNKPPCKATPKEPIMNPTLCSTTDDDETGDVYSLLMPFDWLSPPSTDNYCQEATILTHKNYSLKTLEPQKVWQRIDKYRFQEIELEIERCDRNKKEEYLLLLTKSCFIEHFTGISRQFEQAKNTLIKQIIDFKLKLNNENDIIKADKLLRSLHSNIVEKTTVEIAKELSKIRQIREHMKLLTHGRIDLKEAVNNGMERQIKDEIAVSDNSIKYISYITAVKENFLNLFTTTSGTPEHEPILNSLTKLSENLDCIREKIQEIIT